MNAEAVRAYLAARYDEDERDAHEVHNAISDAYLDSDCICEYPDRVRREVAAKRRRLERHVGDRRRISFITDPDDGSGPTDFGFYVCTACTPHRTVLIYMGEQIIEWPCPDIIDDAQAYRDEPGFPAELRLP